MNHVELCRQVDLRKVPHRSEARVVDQHVGHGPAERFRNMRGTLGLPKIGGQWRYSRTPRLPHLVRCRAQLRRIPRYEKKLIAVSRQQSAQLISDPGGCAGHNSNLGHTRYNSGSDVLLRRLGSIALLLTLAAASCFADLTADQRRANLASFDQVWNTVQEKNWDPTLGGLDWKAVRDELRPKVERARSEDEVRVVIQDMLSRLHLTHYGVVPASVYGDVQSAGSAAPAQESVAQGTSGIDVRVVKGEALVVAVDPNSSAQKLGIRPGWRIERINDEDLAPMLRRVASTYQNSTQQQMMLARSVLGRLEGPLDNTVELVLRDGKDRPVALSVRREPPQGAPEKFGYMPESFLSIVNKPVAADIGYIGFNYFLDPARLTAAFQQTIAGCGACSGIVIDVRGNPGGIGILAMGLAGYFIDQPDLKLGTLYMRDLPMNFVVNPRGPAFHGPLAILIDGLSASTSEIFASGLQDLKRARIFGSPSAGAALPSMFQRLPNGDGFQFAMAAYKSESGKTLEGSGVKPDVAVPLTRTALLAGNDPALDAAVQWIHEQSSKGIKP